MALPQDIFVRPLHDIRYDYNKRYRIEYHDENNSLKNHSNSEEIKFEVTKQTIKVELNSKYLIFLHV